MAKTTHRPHPFRRVTALGLATAGVLLPIHQAPARSAGTAVGTVFVIAMENHNFVQPVPTANPQQILNNPAAPYLNKLITPGAPEAAAVSYATGYFNAGIGVHPSEPNYVWAEAGTDFGVHTDADPRAANHNVFTATHFTAQLDAAGISWKNYQEDVQLSVDPTTSVAGSNGPTNPYYGTGQYNYAVKHNPMAFFPDTAQRNVYPLAQFFTDLDAGTVGAYNWITPNQFNDAHSVLTGGFTYNGTHFTGDQAAIAQGDNFLSIVVPQIMATPEYQNNGVIVIWWDETERGDDPGRTIPEIVISPLAKGNAYASTLSYSHSSDLKTLEEVFGLSFLNNVIPAAETNTFGTGYNNVLTVNDLGDLFVAGAIPAAPSFSVAREGTVIKQHTGEATVIVRISNNGTSAVVGPIYLAVDNLTANATLLGAAGTTAALPPLGSPYVTVGLGGDGTLRPHETKTVQLHFADPNGTDVGFDARVLPVTPTP